MTSAPGPLEDLLGFHWGAVGTARLTRWMAEEMTGDDLTVLLERMSSMDSHSRASFARTLARHAPNLTSEQAYQLFRDGGEEAAQRLAANRRVSDSVIAELSFRLVKDFGDLPTETPDRPLQRSALERTHVGEPAEYLFAFVRSGRHLGSRARRRLLNHLRQTRQYGLLRDAVGTRSNVVQTSLRLLVACPETSTAVLEEIVGLLGEKALIVASDLAVHPNATVEIWHQLLGTLGGDDSDLPRQLMRAFARAPGPLADPKIARWLARWLGDGGHGAHQIVLRGLARGADTEVLAFGLETMAAHRPQLALSTVEEFGQEVLARHHVEVITPYLSHEDVDVRERALRLAPRLSGGADRATDSSATTES